MLLEWLILLMLIPAVLVPVILLAGFAGCKFEHGLVSTATPPANVTATGVSTSEIDVAWTGSNSDDATFTVRRTPPMPGTPMELDAGPSASFPDMGLDPGTMYGYEVKATTTGGSVSSYSTPPVTASTLPALPAFQPTFSATLNVDRAGLDGWCLVQRIQPVRLLRSGTQVRITVSGSTAGNLRLNKVTIAEAAATGDPFDSAAPPAVLETSVLLTPGVPHMTPAIPFALDHTRPLLVAFEIGSPGNARYVVVPQSDAIMYVKQGTAGAPIAEAEVVNRTGYTAVAPQPGVSTVFLVELIEVA